MSDLIADGAQSTCFGGKCPAAGRKCETRVKHPFAAAQRPAADRPRPLQTAASILLPRWQNSASSPCSMTLSAQGQQTRQDSTHRQRARWEAGCRLAALCRSSTFACFVMLIVQLPPSNYSSSHPPPGMRRAERLHQRRTCQAATSPAPGSAAVSGVGALQASRHAVLHDVDVWLSPAHLFHHDYSQRFLPATVRWAAGLQCTVPSGSGSCERARMCPSVGISAQACALHESPCACLLPVS